MQNGGFRSCDYALPSGIVEVQDAQGTLRSCVCAGNASVEVLDAGDAPADEEWAEADYEDVGPFDDITERSEAPTQVRAQTFSTLLDPSLDPSPALGGADAGVAG